MAAANSAAGGPVIDPKINYDMDFIKANISANTKPAIIDNLKTHFSIGHSRGLSGGERQRLALARELFREPHLIILDEPTSALDAVSEKLVMESILQACKDRMTFLVAHKIENLKHCDTVLVFENGCIVEQGGYSELITRSNGVLRLMYETQKAESPE